MTDDKFAAIDPRPTLKRSVKIECRAKALPFVTEGLGFILARFAAIDPVSAAKAVNDMEVFVAQRLCAFKDESVDAIPAGQWVALGLNVREALHKARAELAKKSN